MSAKAEKQIAEMKKQTIGVEIEMNSITREKAAKLASEYFGTGRYENTARRNGYSAWSAWDSQGREWKFQMDVSIAGPDIEKCELVTPILNYTDIETLQELIRRLRKSGAKSDATRGCGVHIHIGAKGHTARTLRNLANILASHENLIASALNIDSGRINHYCRTVDKNFLKELNSKLEQLNHDEWIAQIQALKEKYPLRYESDKLTCPYIIEELDRVTGGKAIVSTDVGQHQMWAAQYYQYTEPRTFLSSGGLGTMGYGLGACIGAKVGMPDKICVNIAGDGCFRMNMNELATASRYNIPIIQIIINNHVLGMVRQWQTLFYEKRYSQTILTDKVDFIKVSEGLGCEAIRVTKREEVGPALERAVALQKPVVIECVIEEDDKVFPMVPAGAAISEAFDAEDLKNRQ